MTTEGSGGDWDRRNRLKVYRALSNLLARDMKESAELLVDCIATFSCNEICSYQDFIVYTILSNLLHLPRPQLKTKIIDGPEILSVASDIPIVVSYLSRFGPPQRITTGSNLTYLGPTLTILPSAGVD